MRITAAVMVWQGAEYIDYCLRGLVGNVDDVIVIEGAIKKSLDAGYPARSNDGTLDILADWQREGVTVIHANEPSIMDQWGRMLATVKAKFGRTWMLCCDDDEIWDARLVGNFRAWVDSTDKCIGGWVTGWQFVNDFWTCNRGKASCFLDTRKNLKWRMWSERAFISGAVNLTTAKMAEPQITGPPTGDVCIYHYSKVKDAEHWERWKKWCPHPKSLRSMHFDGARVTMPDVRLESYTGEHPEHMRAHPYYSNPPA